MAGIKWAALLALITLSSICSAQTGDRQCTGVRVGEVTPSSAIIWTRITATSRRRDDIIFINTTATDVVTTQPLAEKAACAGASGSVQLEYSTASDFSSNVTSTPKISVRETSDYSHKFILQGLLPNTMYYYKSKTYGTNGVAHTPLQGQFKTAPLAAADVLFTVLTCQRFENLPDQKNGFAIYPAMAKLNPDFTISLGDLVYYDNEDPSVDSKNAALYHWQQMYSLPYHTNFLLKYPSYFSPDDHDTLENDCGPFSKPIGSFSFKMGQSLFRQEMPVGNLLYRTFSWGKDVQFWILDSRSYRSNNDSPDSPKKTLLGATQKGWLKSTVLKSTATWKIILTPAPIVGPDEPGKTDNLSNAAWKYEGNEIRKFLGAQKNLFVITGDRHWQYHSVDPTSGLNELCGGPTSDDHAKEDTPIGKLPVHKFYKVAGGFVQVKRKASNTTADNGITVSLHGENGAVNYSYTFKSQA